MPDDKNKKQARSAADVQQDIEYNLIGCLLFKPSFYAEVAGKLKPEYFLYAPHQKVFVELERRMNLGLPTDPKSILQSFADDVISDNGVRLHRYLIESGTSATLVTSVGQVDALRLRYTIAAAEQASKYLYHGDNNVPPDLALQGFFDAVDDVRFDYLRAQGSIDTMSIGDAAEAFAADLSAKLSKDAKDRRVRTGFHGLDNMLGGMGEGDLVIIAGRPGMGKSTLATSIARGAASQLVDVETEKELKPRYPTLFFSLEMPKEQIMARMVAEDIAHYVKFVGRGPALEYRALLNPKSLGECEAWDRVRPEWGESLWSYVDDAQRRMRALPIQIADPPSLTLGELAARARKVRTVFQKQG